MFTLLLLHWYCTGSGYATADPPVYAPTVHRTALIPTRTITLTPKPGF